jgi:hypothetical protein
MHAIPIIGTQKRLQQKLQQQFLAACGEGSAEREFQEVPFAPVPRREFAREERARNVLTKKRLSFVLKSLTRYSSNAGMLLMCCMEDEQLVGLGFV